MGQTLDQMKLLNQLRKAQKDLKNEIVEVEAGDGAVTVQITGELKVKKVKIDPSRVDLDDIHELERWIENCMRDGFAKAQEIATDKMKPLMGGLSGLGFQITGVNLTFQLKCDIMKGQGNYVAKGSQ